MGGGARVREKVYEAGVSQPTAVRITISRIGSVMIAVWVTCGSVETGGSERFVSTSKVQVNKGCCGEDVRAINQGAI